VSESFRFKIETHDAGKQFLLFLSFVLEGSRAGRVKQDPGYTRSEQRGGGGWQPWQIVLCGQLAHFHAPTMAMGAHTHNGRKPTTGQSGTGTALLFGRSTPRPYKALARLRGFRAKQQTDGYPKQSRAHEKLSNNRKTPLFPQGNLLKHRGRRFSDCNS
jgi:hypothetical protein